MSQGECAERIQLADEYSRLITEFNKLLESSKAPGCKRNEEAWKAAEAARAESQTAWEALQKHITEHKCI